MYIADTDSSCSSDSESDDDDDDDDDRAIPDDLAKVWFNYLWKI